METATQNVDQKSPKDSGKQTDGRGWLSWAAMLFFVLFSGHLGAGLLGGGALPYIFGAVVGAAIHAVGSSLWGKWPLIGKAALVLGWLGVVFSGLVLKQVRLSELTRNDNSAKRESVAPIGTPHSPSAGLKPFNGELDQPAPAISEGARLLELSHYNMTDQEFEEGSRAWLSQHKEYWNDKDVAVLQSHLDSVLHQYPMISLGAAFDMALQRALAAGEQERAAKNPPPKRSTDYLPDTQAEPLLH